MLTGWQVKLQRLWPVSCPRTGLAICSLLGRLRPAPVDGMVFQKTVVATKYISKDNQYDKEKMDPQEFS